MPGISRPPLFAKASAPKIPDVRIMQYFCEDVKLNAVCYFLSSPMFSRYQSSVLQRGTSISVRSLNFSPFIVSCRSHNPAATGPSGPRQRHITGKVQTFAQCYVFEFTCFRSLLLVFTLTCAWVDVVNSKRTCARCARNCLKSPISWSKNRCPANFQPRHMPANKLEKKQRVLSARVYLEFSWFLAVYRHFIYL